MDRSFRRRRKRREMDFAPTRSIGASNTSTQSKSGLLGRRKAMRLSLPATSPLNPGPFRSYVPRQLANLGVPSCPF